MTLPTTTGESTRTPYPWRQTSTFLIAIRLHWSFEWVPLLFSSSDGYKDELAWAAAWLAKATGESNYTETARELFNKGSLCDEDDEVPTEFDWDSKTVGVYVVMYELTKEDRCYTQYGSYRTYQQKDIHAI